MRIAAMALTTVTLGVVAFGATACKDDAADASDPATTAPATPGASSSLTVPTPSMTTSPSAHALPSLKKPKVTGSQVIMIDPDGKRYTRKWMVQMAAGMAAIHEGRLPSDFCSRSYNDGIKKGGTFPAGKAAFLEACQEGVRLEKQYRP
jgi:hypothetical protein